MDETTIWHDLEPWPGPTPFDYAFVEIPYTSNIKRTGYFLTFMYDRDVFKKSFPEGIPPGSIVHDQRSRIGVLNKITETALGSVLLVVKPLTRIERENALAELEGWCRSDNRVD